VAAARQHVAPILARGGGTSLAGQCCNVAVMLDMSKYMHTIIALDPDKKLARVQAGQSAVQTGMDTERKEVHHGSTTPPNWHLGVGALLLIFALLPVALAAPRAATQTVSVKDNLFEPKTITVNGGDTVTWQYAGQNEHTVTADDGSFDSGDLKTGEKTSFSFTFTKSGTFAYHCKYHGAMGMVGTVVVQAGGAPAAPAQMPRTGGEEISVGVLLAALALLVAGALLTLRVWRRRA